MSNLYITSKVEAYGGIYLLLIVKYLVSVSYFFPPPPPTPKQKKKKEKKKKKKKHKESLFLLPFLLIA
jgi:hypothetical protein